MSGATSTRFAAFSVEELVLLANSIQETLALLDNESSFRSRIGTGREATQTIWQELSDELDHRRQADPEGYFGTGR